MSLRAPVRHAALVKPGDVTDARDAEEQKTRNWSLAIGPLIVYPDGAG
jgi:hypothetical protein